MTTRPKPSQSTLRATGRLVERDQRWFLSTQVYVLDRAVDLPILQIKRNMKPDQRGPAMMVFAMAMAPMIDPVWNGPMVDFWVRSY